MSYPRAFLRLTTGEDINTAQSQVQSLDLEKLQIPPFKIAPPSNGCGFLKEREAELPVFGSIMMMPEVSRPVLKASFFNRLKTNKDPEKSRERSSFAFPVNPPNYCPAEVSPSIEMRDKYEVSWAGNEIEAPTSENHIKKGKNNEQREKAGHLTNSCKELELSKEKNLDTQMCLRQAIEARNSQGMVVGLEPEVSDDDWEAISISDAVEEFVLVGNSN